MHLQKTLNFPENAFIFNWRLFSGMNIVKLGRRCGRLWIFNPLSAETLIFSLKFDQFCSFSQLTQKVCYVNWKNSQILSKLRTSEPAGVSAMNGFVDYHNLLPLKYDPYSTQRC